VIDTLAKALEIETGVVRAAVARASGRAPNPANSYGRRPDGPQASPQNPAPAGPVKTAAPLTEEVEVIQLLADHPSLIASPEADKAFWLLTDETLRAMYSAARDGQSFLELAPVHLAEPIAKLVMSGKYSDHKDPRAALIAMTHNLELRKQKLESVSLQKKLSDGKRGTGDREVARLEAQLAVARRTGDLEQAERLEAEISSKKKKAE
jgi:hypothetical protein